MLDPGATICDSGLAATEKSALSAGVPVGDGVCVDEIGGVDVTVGDGVREDEAVGVDVAVRDGVIVNVGDGVWVDEIGGVNVAVGESVGVGVIVLLQPGMALQTSKRPPVAVMPVRLEMGSTLLRIALFS